MRIGGGEQSFERRGIEARRLFEDLAGLRACPDGVPGRLGGSVKRIDRPRIALLDQLRPRLAILAGPREKAPRRLIGRFLLPEQAACRGGLPLDDE